MSGAITATIGSAIIGGAISSNGQKSAAAAAATKDNATSTSGYENQSGVDQVAATLKSLGYSDQQIQELTNSIQQQQSQQQTSQTGQTSTSQTGTVAGQTTQQQQQQGNTTTAEQLTNNLNQTTTGSQTQGTVINTFQAGNTDPAQQLFNSTAGGITPEQYQAILAKAGSDLESQVPGLNRALATAAGTSNANNSGLAIGLEQAKQQALLTAAAQSVSASQNAQQIAAGAAGTIAGATTGNNQTLEQWLQQTTQASQQQQQQQTTGSQATTNNTATTGTSNQTTTDLANQISAQTGTQTGTNTTVGSTSTNRSDQTTTSQDTAQNQTTTSNASSNYGEASATDVDSLRPPTVSIVNPQGTSPAVAPAPSSVSTPAVSVSSNNSALQNGLMNTINGQTPIRSGNGNEAPVIPSIMTGGTVKTPDNNLQSEQTFANGGLIMGGGSALPGHAPSRGTAHGGGTPGNAAMASVLMQEANRKTNAVTNAGAVLSKFMSTPLTDSEGNQVKNPDGSPILPAQNLVDALKSATGIGDFFSKLGAYGAKRMITQSMLDNVPGSGAGMPTPDFGGMGGAVLAGGIGAGLDFGGDFNFANGGMISGPGTGTSDSIPAVADNKKPIKVSNGEYIIPADVVDTLSPNYFDNLVAQFHKPI